ncbi:alpha/beta fold hydrolase [Synechococcus sp. PCC 7336]|uniref:alpha/beta fold hydrolase n=1 Tax=Synechococcus sp. PCC 7336 TaxID=195250 RepID=UPI00034BCA7C|nr:alpha/beta hydrolase [Synechococcus sp. PCC 7336]
MKKLAFPLVLLLAAACSPPQTASEIPELAEERVSSVRQGTVAAPDGVSIAYDVRGSGDTALVFVHCWSCDRSYWSEQLDTFADRYRVVALDLGGHGVSGSDREEWSIAGLAGDVEAVVEELDLERAILIGHSMGGPVSLEAARRMPEAVIGVACVDTLHNAEFAWDPVFAEQVADRLADDFIGARTELLGQMFLADGSSEGVLEWVAERGRSANPTAAIALLRDFPNFDLQAVLSEVEVPIRCVNAAPLPPLMPETAIEINQKYSDFDAVIMEGVGHFLLLEQPEAFNAKLDEVLAELSAG